MSRTELFYPQRPYSLIAAINRIALATGTLSNAIKGADADYNGHRVTVDFSSFRSWAATYHWGRLVWLASRTTFESALEAAEREYNRGALGAETCVLCETQAEIEVCLARGYVTPARAEELKAEWQDARFAEINAARDLERWFGIPAPGLLANSATVEEYKAKLADFRGKRRGVA